MRVHKVISLFILTFFLSSCGLIDDLKNELDGLTNDFEEYTDDLTGGGGQRKGEQPVINFQGEQAPRITLIPSSCGSNQKVRYIHYLTPAQAQSNVHRDTRGLVSVPNAVFKPYWDMRYTNNVSEYISSTNGQNYPNHVEYTGLDARTGVRNITVGTAHSKSNSRGSVIQSKCIDGVLAAGTTLNLQDSPAQSLLYGGLSSTFAYAFEPYANVYPWKSNGTGNIMLQAYFDLPVYTKFGPNIGGSVAYNLFLYNQKLDRHLNYVIAVYAFGEAWKVENQGILFDPTTNIVHVPTVIKDNSWYSTISKKSKPIREIYDDKNPSAKSEGRWNQFYRVNVYYTNLLKVLEELKTDPPPAAVGVEFGLSPEDWEVTLVAVQYELEEQSGQAAVSGSFRGFEAFITNGAL